VLGANIGNSVGTLENLGGRLVVIFDGHCGLCNRLVRWLLRRDQRDRMRFAASESPNVAELLARLGFAATETAPSTLVVVRNAGEQEEELLVRSDAAVALLLELPQPWPAVGVALSWVPRPVRNLGYRLVARWRFRIWGRLQSCPLPTEANREKFL